MPNVLLLFSIGLLLLHSAGGSPDESIQSTWQRIKDLIGSDSSYELPSSTPTTIVPLNVTRGPRGGMKVVQKNDVIPAEGLNDPKFHTQLELLLAELECKLSATEQAQQFLKGASRYGLPSTDHLRFFDNFVLSYDRRLKQPVWVLQHLTLQQMQFRPALREYKDFQPDPNIHDYFRVENEDYFRSGFTRGRYSPARDNRASANMLEQSFLLSNVAPIRSNLSGSISVWTRLQRYIHFLSRRSRSMFIITGTLFMPTNGKLTKLLGDPETVSYRVIGERRIGVPSHFYKVFLSEDFAGHYSMEAFLVENSNLIPAAERLQQFRIDVDLQLPLIEKSIGLRFFDQFDRRKVIKPRSMQYGFQEQVYRRFDGRELPGKLPVPPRLSN